MGYKEELSELRKKYPFIFETPLKKRCPSFSNVGVGPTEEWINQITKMLLKNIKDEREQLRHKIFCVINGDGIEKLDGDSETETVKDGQFEFKKKVPIKKYAPEIYKTLLDYIEFSKKNNPEMGKQEKIIKDIKENLTKLIPSNQIETIIKCINERLTFMKYNIGAFIIDYLPNFYGSRWSLEREMITKYKKFFMNGSDNFERSQFKSIPESTKKIIKRLTDKALEPHMILKELKREKNQLHTKIMESKLSLYKKYPNIKGKRDILDGYKVYLDFLKRYPREIEVDRKKEQAKFQSLMKPEIKWLSGIIKKYRVPSIYRTVDNFISWQKMMGLMSYMKMQDEKIEKKELEKDLKDAKVLYEILYFLNSFQYKYLYTDKQLEVME